MIRSSVCSSNPVGRIGRWVLVFILVSVCSAWAGDSTGVALTLPVDSGALKLVPDTLVFAPPPDPSAAGQVTNPADLEQHLTQNPTVALFKSLAIPGWGQFGNRKYTKALFFAGLEAWCLVSALHYDSQMDEARRLFDSAPDVSTRNARYDFLDNKRKNRNKFLWYAGITAFVSMFDAYVDAHLSGSPLDERNEQLSFDVAPDFDGGVRATVGYRF